MEEYNEKLKDKMLKSVVIAGGVLHGINAITGMNVLTNVIGSTGTRIVFLTFAVASMMLMTERDYYLPFLGDGIFPNGLLANHVTPNGADTMVSTVLKPNTKVVYWAAEPCEKCEETVNAWEAYGGYTNSGVTMSDENGVVKFMIRGPMAYNVPYKDVKLQPHVHYRFLKTNGMWSRVNTVRVHH